MEDVLTLNRRPFQSQHIPTTSHNTSDGVTKEGEKGSFNNRAQHYTPTFSRGLTLKLPTSANLLHQCNNKFSMMPSC
jgi:hypothetical protein